jgi:ribosome biogenesis protein SSF1/2
MAGPLGVTHLLLFSKSKETGNTNLRLALTPRGPTLHFRVERYSLCKDVSKSMKSGGGGKGGLLYARAPLLVMNNFTTRSSAENGEGGKDKGKGKAKYAADGNEIPKQLESLTTTIFQSLFPPISPQSTPLGEIRRIMLLNRELRPEKNGEEDVGSYTIDVRHYAITTKKLGVSKRIKRLDTARHGMGERKKKGLPNLGKLEDVADYLLDPAAGGYTSASESEVETDAEVEVLETDTRKVLSRKEMERRRNAEVKSSGIPYHRNVERRAVKLVELGPRMRLRMMKVEDGVCGGKVMWHEFVKKSNMEVRDLDEKWEERRKEKERRRQEQRENVERKKKEKGGGDGKGDDEDMDDEEWDSEDFDDDNNNDEGMELNGDGE